MLITHDYLTIPRRLIIELRDNALALALYCWIGRLYLVAQAPIPLSRSDVRMYDPSIREGAIKRAFDRLIAGGWLIESAGYKSRYVPVWGQRRGSGAPYSWNIGADHLGCPRHIETIRIDRAILDVYMGRFRPHTRNPLTESYFSKPLIRLVDVGAYLLTAAGLPADDTKTLRQWGLVADGHVQPIPDDAVVVARASQRTSIDTFTLTEEGWRKLGWGATRTGQQRPQPPQGTQAAPLIFVPKALIGSLIPTLIGESIGCATFHNEEFIPSASAEDEGAVMTPRITGTHGDSQESRESPPSPPRRTQQGGGAIASEKEKDQEVALPDTEAARALFAFGVNDPTCLVDLATLPMEQVGRAITYAEAEDLGPGWVVTALRRHRDEGWPIPTVRKKLASRPIDWDAVATRYGDLIRRGSDVSDLDGNAVDTALNHVRPGDQAQAQGAALNCGQPSAGAAAQARPADLVQLGSQAGAPSPAPQPVARGHSALELTQELRSRLRAQCCRSYHRVIGGLQVRVADGTTVIHCATLADRLAVLDALMGALCSIVADLGLPPAIRVTDRPPNSLEPPSGPDRVPHRSSV